MATDSTCTVEPLYIVDSLGPAIFVLIFLNREVSTHQRFNLYWQYVWFGFLKISLIGRTFVLCPEYRKFTKRGSSVNELTEVGKFLIQFSTLEVSRMNTE